MKTIKIRLLFLFFFCLAGASANSQFINLQSGSDCGIILMGGGYYNLVNPDYDYKSLYVYNLKDDPVVPQTMHLGRFDTPKLSRSCDYIALLVAGEVPHASALRIITTAGQERLLLPKVLWFDWGTNTAGEDLLGYKVGTPPVEEELSEMVVTGDIWILNIKTDERWKIHPGGSAVSWARYDSSFYIEELYGENYETRVLRYDMQSRQLETTPYFGSNFSKGGTYYYVSIYDIYGFRLFERTNNIEVTEKYTELYKHFTNGVQAPVGWISDSMLVLRSKPAPSEDGRATQQIIDFKNAQLWEVESEVIGLSGQGGRDLVQVTKSGVTIRAFGDVAKLIYPAGKEVTLEAPSP